MIRETYSPKFFIYGILLIAFLGLPLLVYHYLPVGGDSNSFGSFNMGIDWKTTFQPAIQAMISGRSPYDYLVYNPPWVFIPLIPFALLPPALSMSFIFVLGLFGFAYAAYRFHAPPWMGAMILVNPWVLGCIGNGNIDWMVPIGATLPPQIGLFLVLAKPQLGVGLVLLWLVQAWERGGIREVIRVFSPVILMTLYTFIPYGLWPLKTSQLTGEVWWNVSLWPYGLLFGAALLVYALRKRSTNLALASSPLLSRYLSVYSWSIALFGLVNYRAEFIVFWLLSWALRIFGLG